LSAPQLRFFTDRHYDAAVFLPPFGNLTVSLGNDFVCPGFLSGRAEKGFSSEYRTVRHSLPCCFSNVRVNLSNNLPSIASVGKLSIGCQEFSALTHSL